MADRRRFVEEDYARGVRDPRDLRDPRDPRDARDRRADPRDPRRDPRDPQERIDPRPRVYDDSMDMRPDNNARIPGRAEPPRGRGGIDPRMDTVIDPRMEARIDPRMDRGVDNRVDNRMDPRLDPRMDIAMDQAPMPVEYREFRDPRTGQIIREEIPRRPYRDERDRDELQSSRRIIDYDAPREGGRSAAGGAYNDYFLPGEGIHREVIQYEICRYLGQDATVRPYAMQDGRRGYMIRAYRALTTAMIASLKDDSSRYEAEQRKKEQQGRGRVPYTSSDAIEIRDRQERLENRSGGGYRGIQMDAMEEDYPEPPPRSGGGYARERDPDPRLQPPIGRHGQPVVTSGYPPEASYPAYTIAPSPNVHGQYDPRGEPRIFASNTTPPPSARGAQPGYPSGSYPANTQAVRQNAPTVYTDPRTGQVVQNYPSTTGSYTQEPPGRHARR